MDYTEFIDAFMKQHQDYAKFYNAKLASPLPIRKLSPHIKAKLNSSHRQLLLYLQSIWE